MSSWKLFQRVCAGLVAFLGVVGLVAVLILSNTITTQFRQLDPLQKGIATTLGSAAKTTEELATGLKDVEPALGSVETLVNKDVDGVLVHLDSTLGNIEAGLKAAQPPLDVVAKVAEKDVPEVLGVGSKAIGAGQTVLGEVRVAVREISRTTNKTKIEVTINRAQLRDTMTATRQEIARYQPLVVTARDIKLISNYLDSLGLPISTNPLQDHAGYLAMANLEYRVGPNETYVISPASLKQLADGLDTIGLALDTNPLRQQAKELERQGLVIQIGLDPALVGVETNVETGTNIVVSYAGGIQTASGAVDNGLDQAQAQLVVVRGVLERLESQAPVFANGARIAQKLTDSSGRDMAAIRARITDARGEIKKTVVVVPAIRKTLGASRENLVAVSANLKANAAAVESLQLSQMAIQIVSLVAGIAGLFFLILVSIGGYWFASTFKEGATSPISQER